MRIVRLSSLTIICLALAGANRGWCATNATDALATQQLPTLRKLITPQNFALMGFANTQEVFTAVVSMPGLDVYQVRLNGLRSFNPAMDPATILQPPNLRIYPVTVNGQTRSSITLGKYGSNWKPVSFGYPFVAKMLSEARAASAGTTGLALDKFFAVQVRALNAFFLGHYENGKLVLRPVVSDVQLGLVAGQERPADQVFASLVPAAQQHDGLPR